MERLKLNNRPQLQKQLGDYRLAEVERLHRLRYKQTEIARDLGITQARVSQLLRASRRIRSRPMLRLMMLGEETTA